MNECKVIHKQPPIRTQIRSFLTIFDSISRLTSIYFHDGSNYICDPSTTLLYLSCVQILTYYNERVQSDSQTTSDKDSNSVVLTIFDRIQIDSIYFHDGSNYICDPSTTLLYLPCVQISTYYNERMRSSSQTTSDKDSNSFIFDHFDSNSRLIQFYFHDGSNYICDPSTTLLYLPCVQISTYYNERVQSYSQTTSDKDSNSLIFHHF